MGEDNEFEFGCIWFELIVGYIERDVWVFVKYRVLGYYYLLWNIRLENCLVEGKLFEVYRRELRIKFCRNV